MPDTNPAVIPMLSYEDGAKALDWLCKAFGFTERERWLDDKGRLTHGEITLGGGVVMLASSNPDYQSPKHHRESCAQAAKWNNSIYIIDGTRYRAEDIEGHRWMFMQR